MHNMIIVEEIRVVPPTRQVFWTRVTATSQATSKSTCIFQEPEHQEKTILW